MVRLRFTGIRSGMVPGHIKRDSQIEGARQVHVTVDSHPRNPEATTDAAVDAADPAFKKSRLNPEKQKKVRC